jgi:hypothetical protein
MECCQRPVVSQVSGFIFSVVSNLGGIVNTNNDLCRWLSVRKFVNVGRIKGKYDTQTFHACKMINIKMIGWQFSLETEPTEH